jgi:FKBP-type peptidyl-prolyl cis-trans isomerase FklB
MKRIALPALTLLVAISAAWALAQQARPTTPQPTRPAGAGQLAPSQTIPAPARTNQPAAAPGLTTAKQKTSYCVGLVAGADMARHQLTPTDLDMGAVLRGVSDALANAKPAIDDEEMAQLMDNLKQELTNRIEDRIKTVKALGEKNKQLGPAFLAANKAKEGVKTLPSGLQYKVLRSGNGVSPGPTDTVVANYKGTLIDGTVFDSSYDRGKPSPFAVNEVIPGWTEALQLMKVGDKWQLVVPSDLAYGENGRGPSIAPNSVLVFEIELLDVQKGAGGAKGGFSQ